MPNWCDTTYKAVGPKESVKKFYDLAMRSWKEGSEKHPQADKGWLGSFVDFLNGPESAYARGWMQDEPYLRDDFEDYAECTIYCETAWGEPNQWREFIESQIEDLHILYVAIEPGCGVYCSNDDEYEGKYYVDAGPEQPDYPFMTEDEVCEFVEKHYQTNVNSIEDCQAYAIGVNDSDDADAFLYINPMEVEG